MGSRERGLPSAIYAASVEIQGDDFHGLAGGAERETHAKRLHTIEGEDPPVSIDIFPPLPWFRLVLTTSRVSLLVLEASSQLSASRLSAAS